MTGARPTRLSRLLGVAWRVGAVLVGLLVVVAVLLAVVPAPRPEVAVTRLTSTQAEEAYAALVATDRANPEILNECVSIDLPATGTAHGVVVLLHGYTSCPEQLRALGGQLAAGGYRVLIPRLPEHGLRDVFTEPRPMDLQRVADFADRIADIASGLSETVLVGGLSGGGTLALWLGTHRTDVDRVLSMATMLNPKVVPTALRAPAGNLLRWTPNIAVWWEPDKAYQPPVPRYSYGQYATRSIATLMALGADDRGPGEQETEVVFVVNDNDGAVDNQAITDRAAAMQGNGDAAAVYVLPASLGLDHEFIDPAIPANAAAAGTTFPALIDLLTTGTTDRLATR